MATKRLYYNLVKSFTPGNITSIFGEMTQLELLGFTFSDKEELKSQFFSARTKSSGKTFLEETKNYSEKAIRNLLNLCGALILRKNNLLLEILPLRPIGCYVVRKVSTTDSYNVIEQELYCNPFQMFEDIRSMEGFNFDIMLIQKHIVKSISENAVLDFAACRKEFEYAKVTDEFSVPFDVGVRFVSANEVLGKEIEIIGTDGQYSVEFLEITYMGHIDMYAACMLVKNTPENLPIIKKLIQKFGWQHATHFWTTEPIEEMLEQVNL